MCAACYKPASLGECIEAVTPRLTREAPAYGDSMPASMETKRLNQHEGMTDAAKGHPRDEKHRKQKGSNEERLADEGPGVKAAPGEEDVDQDVLRDRRE